ncbi:protein kinase domain-containing protein [Verrucomicrobiota bacterium sgz303538]
MLNSPRRHLEVVIRNNGRNLARCLIRRGRYVIGHDRKNEIVVDEDSISGTHARLTVVSDTEMFIEDLGSANGTYVNGAPVEGHTPVTLSCVIHLGQNTLEFQRGGLPAAVFEQMPEGFLRANRYTLGSVVVQGRTSTIYQAHDTSLNREVALKTMLPESQASAAHVRQFIREAQISSQLQHPGIPPVYELSINEESQLYYTTRFVEGETLASIIDNVRAGDTALRERFSLAGLISVLQKACDAVAYAHSHGVIHGSLRPEYILVGAFGEVFVTTWGLARVLPPEINEEGVSAFNSVSAPEPAASPLLSAYSAPEQATESYDMVDARTDVYALGAILYRLVMLQDAISAGDDQELLSKILLSQHTPPASLARHACPHWPGGKFPEYLATLAMKSMAPSREDRPSSVAEFQKQLSAWQEGGDTNKLLKGMAGFLGRH